MDTQIKHSFPYGDAPVFFEKEEINNIKAIDKPGTTQLVIICVQQLIDGYLVAGIRLMGFKPISTLKHHYNLKHAYFIYPDDAAIRGSTITFTAILDRMLALHKIAICRWTPRANTPPKFVALYPTVPFIFLHFFITLIAVLAFSS